MSIATERLAKVSVTVGGQEISFETGKLAKQADGSVVVRSGDTMVLATAQGRMEAREGADFFPLTVDGELVVNPTLPDVENDSNLDLIVVGTKDALTMVEAGGDPTSDETILEALELAQGEIVKLCEAQEDLRRQAGKPKWLDMELYAEIEREHGHTLWERIQSVGLREAGAVVEELAEQLAGSLTMDSTDEDIQ